tara:strand:- start:5650 stop:6372 length:723 start_codon:yes stop_codon:yes gene_type:complete
VNVAESPPTTEINVSPTVDIIIARKTTEDVVANLDTAEVVVSDAKVRRRRHRYLPFWLFAGGLLVLGAMAAVSVVVDPKDSPLDVSDTFMIGVSTSNVTLSSSNDTLSFELQGAIAFQVAPYRNMTFLNKTELCMVVNSLYFNSEYGALPADISIVSATGLMAGSVNFLADCQENVHNHISMPMRVDRSSTYESFASVETLLSPTLNAPSGNLIIGPISCPRKESDVVGCFSRNEFQFML